LETAVDSERIGVQKEWIGRRILIADDVPQLRNLYSTALELQGYKVLLTVESGEEVVKLAKLGKLDIVDVALLDYSMGDVNGLVAGIEATKSNPRIKIIIDSANPKIKDQVSSSGFSFLRKPFGQTELLKLLDSIRKGGPPRSNASGGRK
jgi:DNA-binding NtrC family response regulator